MRIVFTTWGSLGDLHPYIAIARELKRRGHDAVIATLSQWRSNIEAAGLEFRRIRPDIPEDQTKALEMVRRLLDTKGGPAYLFKEVLGPRLRDTYDDTRAALADADLVVSHQIPVTTPIVVQQTDIKWVSCVLLPMGFFSIYDPPTPAEAPWLRDIAARHHAVARAIMWVARRVTEPWMKSVYELRESLGMPRGQSPAFEGQHSPARVLALFSPVFAPKQPDFPPQTVITGFPFYDGADADGLDPELARFFQAGEPPIVFTLGSSAVWIAEDFYDVAAAAARQLGKRALLLAGRDAAALGERLRADGQTIRFVDYAPHSLVMPRASVVVHQGGVGTTAQALRAGRPMLVVSYGQDQPDNARRCVGLGVARTIPRAKLRLDRLTRNLQALLSDAEYTRRAVAVGEQIRAEHGAERAADEIEAQLN